MKVICAIGMQGGAEIVRRLLELIGSQHELYLLDVIDSGPRNTLEDYLHGPRHLRRPPPPPPAPGRPSLPPEREQPIDEAEQAAGRTALEEARQEAERELQLHECARNQRPGRVGNGAPQCGSSGRLRVAGRSQGTQT